MKFLTIALSASFFLPVALSAQDVEESPLAAISMAEQKEGLPPPVVVTEQQKIDHIVAKVLQENKGKQVEQDVSRLFAPGAGDPRIKAAYIEALIHSEGADAIRQYHGAVRSQMKSRPRWTNVDTLHLTINEIKMLSHHMNWRSMRSHLSLLDRYSADHFPIWTAMRVESWLVQAETMLVLQPDGDDKKRAIEGLVAKIKLAQKTSDELEHDFTISDRVIDIEEGRIQVVTLPTLSEMNEIVKAEMTKEEGENGFFGKMAKKLKFW